MKTVLMHPGFLETPVHFRRLKKELAKHGLALETHACHNEAAHHNTVLHLSHSGGVLCKTFEATNQPKLLVAPPLRGHRIRRTLTFKLAGDLRWALQNKELGFWAYKTLRSTLAIFKIKKWKFMITSVRSYEPSLDEILDAKHIRVIANTEDPFTETLCDDKRCIVLDGHHDDLLYRPAFYVPHIQEMIRR